jgi:protein MpaA
METDRSRQWRRGGLAALITLAVIGIIAATTLNSPASRPRRHQASASERTAEPLAGHVTIGRSVQGRPIRAIRIGVVNATRTVLVIGCIHGNESAGIAIARRLETASAPPGSALWILPDLNPDGVAAHTRQNADHVDLNRNFPWHWRPLGVPGDLQYSGPRPLSEPEARAAARLILRVRPQITIWFHQPQALVDLAGGDARIERKFARLVGLPVARLTRYPGSAVSWGNAQLPDTTAFVVELPLGSLNRAAVARYAKAVLVLADPRTSL